MCIFLLSCSDYKHLSNLELELTEIINQGAGTTFLLNLDSVANFEWDELIILEPYSTLNNIEDHIGYRLDCVPASIQPDERTIVFVFFNNENCIGYTELNRNFKFVSLPKTEKYPLFSKKDCILSIKAYD